jgi:hypothetical protein
MDYVQYKDLAGTVSATASDAITYRPSPTTESGLIPPTSGKGAFSEVSPIPSQRSRGSLPGLSSSTVVSLRTLKGGLCCGGGAAQKKGRLFVAARSQRKGCIVDLDRKATEKLANLAVWSQESLEYAREHGQRKLIWLLEAVRVEVKLEAVLLTLPLGEHLGSERGISSEKRKARQRNQSVADMTVDLLARQAGDRAKRTGEPFEEALKSVLETEAGRQLGELRDGPHRDEKTNLCQEDLVQQRAREQAEEKSRAQQAAWERFMHAELRELELRKGGQLARLLGEPLPGEPPAALEGLASADQRQAEEGLVALMSGGKVSYKHVAQLSEKDMPARIAANRARTTWLKERQDGWLGRGDGS